MSKPLEIKNIKLSFVCERPFKEMTPCQSGRFCDSCNKTVIDFTNAKVNDLKKALKENGSVCGRFTKAQMLENGSKPWRFNRFWAGLFLAVGFGGLVNNAKAQIIITDSIPEINYEKEDSSKFYSWNDLRRISGLFVWR